VRLVDRSAERLGSWLTQAACFVGVTFALACMTYYLIERPALVMRDRLLVARANRVRPATMPMPESQTRKVHRRRLRPLVPRPRERDQFTRRAGPIDRLE